MHCAGCAGQVERALASQDGVVSAAVNFATSKAYVSFDGATTAPDELCEAVAAVGYSAAGVTGKGDAGAEEHSEHWSARAGVGWALSLAALSLAMFAREGPTSGWSVLVLAVLVETLAGWPFLRGAVRLLRHGATSMDTLVAVGTLAALAVSAVEAVALGGRHVHLGGGGAYAARLHGVMAPLIVSILATGRAIEERARLRASRALGSLLELRPPVARVVTDPDDDRGELVAPETVPAGALIRVRPGETIPLDGTVVTGWSAVDESMLTGEAFPVDRGPEAVVTGGTRNGNAVLVVRVSTVAAESVLSRLQRLVEEAQRDKAPLQKVADRVSSVFVPVILVATLVTFLSWWLLGGNFGTAVLSAIALLLVACPCAMGLATPVAMMVGSGPGGVPRHPHPERRRTRAAGGSRSRGLRQDGDAHRAIRPRHRCRCRCRSGAAGPPPARPRALHPCSPWQPPSRPRAATLSPSRFARLPATQVSYAATRIEELAGSGISGVVDGRSIEVVRRANVAVPAVLDGFVSERESRGETVVVVTEHGSVIGAIAVSTPLRSEAAAAVSHLRSMGLRSVLLSGDSAPAVNAAAGALGICDARSGLRPADKLAALRSLQADGRHVLMVGDGTNDAPALAAADVGCAVGSGTEAALATSDICLLGSDLEGVPAAVGIARSTLATIHQNFGWAMGYNLAALPLAAAGLLDPLVAAGAMGASSLVVVLNSLRLLRLGRSGREAIGGPRVTSRWRILTLSLLLPMALFGGATAAAEAVSPARGQPLLPVLASISDFSLPGGSIAEAYLSPGSTGVNALHVIFLRGGEATPATSVSVAGSRSGAPARLFRPVRLSKGHFVAYALLPTGSWRFRIRAYVAGRAVTFVLHRVLS